MKKRFKRYLKRVGKKAGLGKGRQEAKNLERARRNAFTDVMQEPSRIREQRGSGFLEA